MGNFFLIITFFFISTRSCLRNFDTRDSYHSVIMRNNPILPVVIFFCFVLTKWANKWTLTYEENCVWWEILLLFSTELVLVSPFIDIISKQINFRKIFGAEVSIQNLAVKLFGSSITNCSEVKRTCGSHFPVPSYHESQADRQFCHSLTAFILRNLALKSSDFWRILQQL